MVDVLVNEQKDYVDADVPCSLQGHRVKMRCTSRGIITCRFPWKKCTFKKQDPDTEDCTMNVIVKGMAAQMRQIGAQKTDTRDALLAYVLSQRRGR